MDKALPPERKRRRAPDETRPADKIAWREGGKMREIERWTASVLADDELPPQAKYAAWVLSFRFSSSEGRAWERREITASRYGLKLNTFRQSLQWLERRGHIVRGLERVPRLNKPIQVTRPAIPKGVVVPYPSDYRPVAVPQPSPVAAPHPDPVVPPQICIPSTNPVTNPLPSEDSQAERPKRNRPIKCEDCFQNAEAHYQYGSLHFYKCYECGAELREFKSMVTVETY